MLKKILRITAIASAIVSLVSVCILCAIYMESIWDRFTAIRDKVQEKIRQRQLLMAEPEEE